MKEKFEQFCDILTEEEAASVLQLLEILLENIEEDEINVCTSLSNFKLQTIYKIKILSLFKNDE
jgi:hypothetical protein